MAKIGINDRKNYPPKIGVTFVIIDNKSNLNENGVNYLCHWLKKLVLVGGKNVSTSIDGETISSSTELNRLKALELIECKQFLCSIKV